MNSLPHTRSLVLIGLGAILVAASIMILIFATGSAVASPQVGSTVYLPYVTSPLVPVDEYDSDFNDDIKPWKAVRWQKGASYDVDHNGAGYLDVEVNSKNMYVIVSPLIPGPTASYNITFHAKLHDRKDKAQYGAIFGGDWQGAPCPGDNIDGCFNEYFEFRVRYRDVDGEKYMEYRLRRVRGHDGNNVEQGDDVIDWTRATDVNPEDWNKWEVHYGSSGHIKFKANNHEQAATARDSGLTQSRFFGLYAKAGENGDVDASFDKFKIVKEK